jgi:vacuolar-type H+-ATPase subunit H
MDMKLPEVLEVLLKAEDEALEMKNAAGQEAGEIIRKTHEKFLQEQETRLATARDEAHVQVESARRAAEMDALHISDLARKGREKMQALFEEKSPDLIARLAEEVASRYATQGRF